MFIMFQLLTLVNNAATTTIMYQIVLSAVVIQHIPGIITRPVGLFLDSDFFVHGGNEIIVILVLITHVIHAHTKHLHSTIANFLQVLLV